MENDSLEPLFKYILLYRNTYIYLCLYGKFPKCLIKHLFNNYFGKKKCENVYITDILTFKQFSALPNIKVSEIYDKEHPYRYYSSYPEFKYCNTVNYKCKEAYILNTRSGELYKDDNFFAVAHFPVMVIDRNKNKNRLIHTYIENMLNFHLTVNNIEYFTLQSFKKLRFLIISTSMQRTFNEVCFKKGIYKFGKMMYYIGIIQKQNEKIKESKQIIKEFECKLTELGL
jgi:hypothetical protein